MSAGVCGKRVGFEEIFGSSSSSSKRSRCSNFGSPTPSAEYGSGSEDPFLILLNMFPTLDPELVKRIYGDANNKVEEAKERLQALSLGVQGEKPAVTFSGSYVPEPEEVEEMKPLFGIGNVMDGSQWVDLFVNEMMNASDPNDARRRAANFLEGFERSISTNSNALKEHEYVLLKENLHSLLNDNQILKRAIAIQQERNLEQDEKTREVQRLKLIVTQYQEQVHKLELSNYALKLHLQKAEESSSIPGHFRSDIY